MTRLRGKDRYEISGETVLFIPTEFLDTEQLSAIHNKENVTFSARNENTGVGHGRMMGRSIMSVVRHTFTNAGINVVLKLHVDSLPVSAKELDKKRY